MNDIKIKLLNAKLYLNYYKNNNILDRYATIIERLVIDNDCLSVLKNPNEKLYITLLSKNVNKEEKYKNLEQILELTSKSLDNISYDQIPIAIEELKFKLQDLEQIEKEHKEENGRLRDRIKELEEKQIHRYNKECLNCGVNFIAKRIDTGYCKKCSHIVANRKYKQKNKEKVNAYAKIYMRKRRANKVEEDK